MFAMHSVFLIRPVHIIADELHQKRGTVFILFLPFDRKPIDTAVK